MSRPKRHRAHGTVQSGGRLLKLSAAAVLAAGMIAGTYAFAGSDPGAGVPLVNVPASASPAVSSVAPSTAPATPTPPTTEPAPAPAPASTAAETSPEQQMVVIINQRRAEAGCGPVHSDDRLAQAAEAHSADMAAQGYFSHTSLDGSSPWDRARRAGYDWATAENLAAGNATAEASMEQLMNSPGHRANILNCAHKAVGVGRATGGPYRYYWTQMFGSR